MPFVSDMRRHSSYYSQITMLLARYFQVSVEAGEVQEYMVLKRALVGAKGARILAKACHMLC
jgi:hypothetical protein